MRRLALTIVIFAIAHSLEGQPTATLSGRIESERMSFEGVRIEVCNAYRSSVCRSVAVGAQGNFLILGLRPGYPYHIAVVEPRGGQYRSNAVRLLAGESHTHGYLTQHCQTVHWDISRRDDPFVFSVPRTPPQPMIWPCE